MKVFLTLFTGFLLIQPVLAKDADPANGGKLFIPSACNIPELTSPKSTVTDVNQLDAAVRACDVEHNINWYDDEIHDVVAYLNQTYYKLK